MSHQKNEQGPEAKDTSAQQEDHSESEDSDAGVVYIPIFETGEQELPRSFTHELTKFTYAEGIRWTIANNTVQPLEGTPTPFYHSTIEQVYDYWKAHLPDDPECNYYTFLVVDDQCLQSEPAEIIVACDAPDYGEAEDETRLKSFRMSLEAAVDCLDRLENLIMTPSEAQNPSGGVLSFQPPATMMPARDENGEYSGTFRLATREEARNNRRRMISSITN